MSLQKFAVTVIYVIKGVVKGHTFEHEVDLLKTDHTVVPSIISAASNHVSVTEGWASEDMTRFDVTWGLIK